MKFVEIKNASDKSVSISQIRGFRLAPGESTKVHPATAAHPAVRRLLPPLGSSLELVTQGNTAEVEPIAPANPQETVVQTQEAPPVVTTPSIEEVQPTEDVPAPVAEVPAIPVADTETPVEEVTETPVEDTEAPTEEVTETPVEDTEAPTETNESDDAPAMAGKTLREVFTAGPGVTDSNVDALLDAFDSLESLAASSKDVVVGLGFTASSAKKLLSWARSETN